MSLLRIDHVGYDTSHARGTSAKGDDVDVVFKAELVEGKVVLRRTHTRIPWVPASVTFTREEEPYYGTSSALKHGPQELRTLLIFSTVWTCSSMPLRPQLCKRSGQEVAAVGEPSFWPL